MKTRIDTYIVAFLSQRNAILWLVLFNLIVRILVVFSTTLGNDDVYYTLYARYLDWSYFDHPPMVAYFIRLFTLNGVLLCNDFFARLASLFVGSLNLFLVYKIGVLLKDKLTGLVAATLLATSFYGSVIVGVFILPDTSQSVFWLASLCFFLKFIKTQSSIFLIVFGAMVGLSMLSKYHAVYLWVGALFYLLIYDRKSLFSISTLIALIFTLALFSPVIYWNITSPMSGIAYHSSRVGGTSWIPSLAHFFPTFFGQIFYHNPFVVGLIFYCVWVFRNKIISNKKIFFLLLTSLPLLLTTTVLSLYNETLPHWSGPAFYGFVLIASFFYSHRQLLFQRVIAISHSFFILVIVLGLVQINTGLLLGKENLPPNKLGSDDFTIDLAVWKEAGAVLSDFVKSDSLLMKQPAILCDKWFPAAHIDYYMAIPNGLPLFVLGDLNSQHLYAKINQERGIGSHYGDVYFVCTSRYFCSPKDILKTKYEYDIAKPVILTILKERKKRMNLFVWRLKRK
jgi:4-amino-4-deoxy-L-arabinose transferase-like glycosyltransferase